MCFDKKFFLQNQYHTDKSEFIITAVIFASLLGNFIFVSFAVIILSVLLLLVYFPFLHSFIHSPNHSFIPLLKWKIHCSSRTSTLFMNSKSTLVHECLDINENCLPSQSMWMDLLLPCSLLAGRNQCYFLSLSRKWLMLNWRAHCESLNLNSPQEYECVVEILLF